MAKIFTFRNNNNVVLLNDFLTQNKLPENEVLVSNTGERIFLTFRNEESYKEVTITDNKYKALVECVSRFLTSSNRFIFEFNPTCLMVAERENSNVHLIFIVDNKPYDLYINEIGLMKFANIGYNRRNTNTRNPKKAMRING